MSVRNENQTFADAQERLAAVAAAAGLSIEELLADVAAAATPVAIGASATEIVKRRTRKIRKAPLPEELLPTKEKLLAHFYRHCKKIGVAPSRGMRRAVVRLRITVQEQYDKPSEAPIRQMELAAEECARFGLIPEVVVVEIGQTAYVAFDEEAKRPEFNEFLDDIGPGVKKPLPGKYDGWVLVCQRVDRVVRTMTFGSLVIERCIAHGVDILEFGRSAKLTEVPDLKEHKYLLYKRFEKAQQEHEDTQDRQSETRQWKINRGDLAGNSAGVGHVQVFASEPGRTRMRLVGVRADPEYKPYVIEILERLAAHESVRSITRDLNVRAQRGGGLFPPPLIDENGNEVYSTWRPMLIKSIAKAPRLVGKQRNAQGALIPCPAIERLVDDDLWERANSALRQAADVAAGYRSKTGGGVPTKIGVGLLTCEGCGDTAHAKRAKGGGYKCARRNRGLGLNGGQYGEHFQVPDAVDLVIRDVTIGLLESVPAITERAKRTAAERLNGEGRRVELNAQRDELEMQRERVLDLYVTGKYDEAKRDEKLTPIDHKLDELSKAIATTFPRKRSVLDSLLEGETWGSRWDKEYAKPDNAGLPWLSDLLTEVWEKITVRVGPLWRGCRAEHEARLTFFGRDGFSVDPAFVLQVAGSRYAERMQSTSSYGWTAISDEATDALFRMHHEQQWSRQKISDEMNALADDNVIFAASTGPRDYGKCEGRWTPTKVGTQLMKVCAERGIDFVANGRSPINRDDLTLLTTMTTDHGLEAAVAMMNTLGRTFLGRPWTNEDAKRVLGRKPQLGGRKRVLTNEMLDLAATLQNQGKTLTEIKAFLAAQPEPIQVSVPTLSRRLFERRERLAREAADARVDPAAGHLAA
jgi:DNA invertase Pin-like site-specific DNA recombinase